jgi:hypothetical protein
MSNNPSPEAYAALVTACLSLVTTIGNVIVNIIHAAREKQTFVAVATDVQHIAEASPHLDPGEMKSPALVNGVVTDGK